MMGCFSNYHNSVQWNAYTWSLHRGSKTSNPLMVLPLTGWQSIGRTSYCFQVNM